MRPPEPPSITIRGEEPAPKPPPDRPAVAEVDPQVVPVIEAARRLLGQHQVVVKGRNFRYDCSGFIRGITSVLGVDVMGEAGDDGDNGVRLIHHWVERHGENHQRKLPRPGDLVYFDNTWDKNGNGKLDDPLTHVGLVESVADDGTLQILHRANRGIVRDPMNLLRPHDTQDGMKRPINSILRPKGKRDPSAMPHLMSELWAGFGTLRGPAVAERSSADSLSDALPEAILGALLACDCPAEEGEGR